MVWFWWFILFSDLLIPILMIISGRMMWRHCPKEINHMIGYRTSRSMKNIDTWKYANEYMGKLWWKIGWIILIPSIIIHIPFYNASDNCIGNVGLVIIIIQVIIMLFPIFLTERSLKEKFKDNY